MIDTIIIKEPVKVVSVEREMLDGRMLVKSINFVDLCKRVDAEYTKEVVPETWKELKKLCFKLPNKIEYYTYNEEELIGISGMYFWQKGRITHNIYDDGVYVYAKNRTPQQMWQIIKSLTEQK